MKPLKIYLGDLTYDTITLSTETMPLNIGYLAAYCKEKFGASIEITLFKNIEKHSKRKFADCFTNENIHHLISGLDPVVHLQPTKSYEPFVNLKISRAN